MITHHEQQHIGLVFRWVLLNLRFQSGRLPPPSRRTLKLTEVSFHRVQKPHSKLELLPSPGTGRDISHR